MFFAVGEYGQYEGRRQHEHEDDCRSHVHFRPEQAQHKQERSAEYRHDREPQPDHCAGFPPGDIGQHQVISDGQQDQGSGRSGNEIRAGVQDAADAGGDQRLI